MQQVFINLIKNAAEATPSGGRIVVRIEPVSRPNDLAGSNGSAPMTVGIHVEDSGSGIAPEHQATLFEPFFTTKKGGTGLGLYISHEIVKRHGGSLTVQSEPGRGTRFSVELPLETHGGTP
jgi:signal transduction histidine kinase